MNGKTKMIVGMVLVLGIVLSAVFLVSSSSAYVGGSDNGDQDQERLRINEQDREGDMLQAQAQERLRTQKQDCNNYCLGGQDNANQTRNCEMNMEQYRHQNRERTGNL